MGDISVSIGGDTINVRTGNGDVSVQTGAQVTAKDVHRIQAFTGDGTNQTVVLDNSDVARENSIIVLFSGIPGEVDVDYTVAANRTSITLANSFKASRKGEIRYVVN